MLAFDQLALDPFEEKTFPDGSVAPTVATCGCDPYDRCDLICPDLPKVL